LAGAARVARATIEIVAATNGLSFLRTTNYRPNPKPT